MKRPFIYIFLAVLLMFQTPVMAQTPSVYYDGEQLLFESDPYIANERTMVPFRALFEAADADVLWDEDTKTVIAFKTADEASTTIAFQVGQAVAFVNGEKVDIDAPAELKDGFTFVPLRFIMETLGAEVLWDGDTYTVNIKTK